MKTWTPSNLANAKPVTSDPNRLSILEFQDNKGEWHNFDVLKTPDRLVFGGYCNAGFLESGYIERSEWESLDETLSELLSDLEAYYNDGPQYVSRIVVNECM
jgi:hypothetical protein